MHRGVVLPQVAGHYGQEQPQRDQVGDPVDQQEVGELLCRPPKLTRREQVQKVLLSFSLRTPIENKWGNEYLFTVTCVKKMKWFLSLARCHFQPRVTEGH